jgi:hypothetical protein
MDGGHNNHAYPYYWTGDCGDDSWITISMGLPNHIDWVLSYFSHSYRPFIDILA